MAIGNWCWGHDTSVSEQFVGDLADGAGTGTVVGIGDEEVVVMESTEDWISTVIHVDTTSEIEILYDVYRTGSGGAGTVFYRVSATKAGCADPLAWTSYTGHFTPGETWMQVRILK